jgi:uncharacterized surface protein with fasciclin (FAS1) repeats
MMRFKLIAVAVAAVASSLATVVCSASAGAAPRAAAGHDEVKDSSVRAMLASRPVRLDGTRASGADRAATAPAPGTTGRLFGIGCAQLPRIAGTRSRRGLPQLPVATAIAQVPVLSVLSRAIRLAGLTRMLNTAPYLTVFAPDNAAFAFLGSGNLQALFSTRSDLEPVLKFQIVAGRVRPAELARRRVLTTIAGTKIYPARAAPSYFVNNGWITCGALRTANATVYIVNQVLIPNT